MKSILLVRYGEVHLKGLNRPYFMRALMDNIKRAVRPLGGYVWMAEGRIFVRDYEDEAEALSRVSRVFGVHAVCPAVEMEKADFERLSARCVDMMRGLTGSFKVSARRSDKRYPMDSMEIEREIGYAVLTNVPELRVDVHRPDHVLNVEIRDNAYLHVRQTPGVGGMPMGTGGRAALLLSGGIDSPVAGYQLARRGVELIAIHFYSFPYTSERAKQKVIDLARVLADYTGALRVFVVPFTEAQLAIHEHCPDELGTLIMRRMMMRIAERIAREQGAKALITGESLGQVASQTLDALAVTDAVANMPVFRPLIGLDKLEISEIARRIGTFELSILPYEDCCTVFTPRHPTTHPKPERVALAEQALDIEALAARAASGVEIIEAAPTGARTLILK